MSELSVSVRQLIAACRDEDLDEAQRAGVVAVALQLGFAIEEPVGEDGGTLLHNAAYSGAAATVRVLLDHGASVRGRDLRWHSQPLEWACIGSGERPTTAERPDWLEVVEMLLLAGAQTDELPTSPDQPKPPDAAVADLLRARGVH